MKISAVIPVYNEEHTVGGVVRAIKSSPLISEIIVVSDGSTDQTAERAREAGADKVYELPVNHGKGYAIVYGVEHASAPILLFADADLLGMTSRHVEALLSPIIDGTLAMCCGIRDRGKFFTNLSAHLLWITGERALKREIIEKIPPRYLQKFMLEPSLNYYCRIKKLPYGCVILHGLKIRRKLQKVGILLSLGQYRMMWYQIIKAMILMRVAGMLGRF